jgi:hypothetical protein
MKTQQLLSVFGSILFFVGVCIAAHAQAVSCTSGHDTAHCSDGKGNVTYVICSGDTCISGTYQQSVEEMQTLLNGYYKPKEHRDALCGGDDVSGELFPTTAHLGVQLREPLLPKKYCIAGMGMFKDALDKDYLKNFEKNVFGLCSTKKLNPKQCDVLARDIQYQKELDKVDR